jgi:glutamine amidotransferase
MSGVPTIAIVDYGMGNRRSVQKAFEHVGAAAVITNDHDRIRTADGVVIPGVGAFPLAMRNLAELELIELIRARATERAPILGICLGMQLLFERSTELEPTDGLGLLGGDVRRLDAPGLRLPHIGWNEVRFERECALTEHLPATGAPFYHVHSFAARPADSADAVGTTAYGTRFATIVARDSVFGVQFHPEKSSSAGLRMLETFAALCARVAA